MPEANDRLVRAARELLRWDQQQLAEKAKVSLITVRRYEIGQRIAAKTVAKITAALRKAGVAFVGPEEDGRTFIEGVALTADARPFDRVPRADKKITAEPQAD